ncbi:LytTR family transcriptional regulator DNA-binding domain-containing protein [Hymenobacter sp. M29]|uniref:LytTR family transcriptional regulator DNA-binding domain-containing protein n=1 Tax=Hymenobacter mellowenesis TaxID=3063995 RepID=A0ABT9AHD7_9BACT|nr:LytTR family transcriptional regulator DNA-binding domain-containing protein [Hymenobacter sp. M29]MDO7849282.1 LytTR family transcriptional regulator DNA-binding domain-containing protein [Hymenobacter sp. M29]
MKVSSPIRLLLAENEPLAARLLSVLVRGLGYEPVGPAATAEDALVLFRESLPPVEMALLDIGLDGSRDGIELAQELRALRPLPIIFLTSFADQATFGRAKQARPAAYLLKPYDAAALEHALELALVNYAAGQPAALPAGLSGPPEGSEELLNLPWSKQVLLSDCLFLRDRGRLVKVCLADVHYVEATDKYCTLVTATGRYLSRQPLRELALELPPNQFIQIQRGYLVNVSFIESIDEGQTAVVVANTTLPLSRGYRDALLHRLRLVG